MLEGRQYSEKIDIWSLGVLTFSLLTGDTPFDDEDDDDITIQNIVGCKIQSEEDWQILSDDAKDFILSCLQVRPEERLTSEDAQKHKWLLPPRPSPSEIRHDSVIETTNIGATTEVVDAKVKPTASARPLPSPSIAPKRAYRARRISHSLLTPEEQQKAFKDWVQEGEVEHHYTLSKVRRE